MRIVGTELGASAMAVLDLTTELLFQLLFVRFPEDIWEEIRPNLKITEFRLQTGFTAIVPSLCSRIIFSLSPASIPMLLAMLEFLMLRW